jgi:hypothetical protein
MALLRRERSTLSNERVAITWLKVSRFCEVRNVGSMVREFRKHDCCVGYTHKLTDPE